MNPIVNKLVTDYARRLFGVWLLIGTVATMQASALWANGLTRLPLIGALIGAMAFFATFNAPHAVLRTLPLRRRDVALVRWWVAIGLPAMFTTGATLLALSYNWRSGFPLPPLWQTSLPIFANIAALGILSALPLPALTPGHSNFPRFVAVWTMLAAGALYGFPVEILTAPVAAALGASGMALAAMSFVKAREGVVFQFIMPDAPAGKRGWRPFSGIRWPRLRGWPSLFAQLLRTTVLLALTCILCGTAIRHYLPRVEIMVPLILVSAAGTAGALLARRWLNAVGVMQCLPVSDRMIALIVCITLTTPGLVTCLACTAIQWFVPSWGVAVPLFMIPVFIIIPMLLAPWRKVESGNSAAASIQQWSPVIQIALWPAWAGAFFSFALTKLLPTWFGALAAGLTIAVALIGYFGVLAGVRAGIGLETSAGPLAAH